MKRNLKISIIGLFIIMTFFSSFLTVNAASKTAEKTERFYGIHTTYGASIWGVNFEITAQYNNSGMPYTVNNLFVAATMRPKHTYGVGEVIIAGVDETVDYGTTVSRLIRPTVNPFWQNHGAIVSPGTHVYYSYNGNPNKSFYYSLMEEGTFTFAVPDTYFADPNAELILSVATPKRIA
ncbi:MAG: hypothetical protein DBY08_04110 [Clostridiales bacterium]|nr:MAG: hypothetical protein DBY08_04110 [Clostridiales bacterium]